MNVHSAKPLQLREVVAAAEEYLMASALPGLEAVYLPTRLEIAVAALDSKCLAPFLDRLREDVAAVARRLALDHHVRELGGTLAVSLAIEPELAPGEAPRFAARFPEGARSATWSAAGAPSGREPARAPEVHVELLFTLGGTTETARETLLDVMFGSPDLGGEPPGAETSNLPYPPLPLPPSALDGTGLAAHRFRAAITRGGVPRRPRIEATSGALVVGRSPERAQVVPPEAPPNLSGRHLALARAEHGGIWVLDLASTNGTYVRGERLEPYRPLRLDLPATLEVGREGSLRVEIRPKRESGRAKEGE